MDELMSQSVMNPGWRLEHSSRVVHISEDAFATDRSEVEPEESRGNLRCRRLFHAQHSQRVNFLPFIQPMDTIRSKIYALHSELSEALFKATRAEQTSSLSTEEAKQLEVKQRDLLKKIANKENDLDKMVEDLEKTQKSMLEKTELLEVAKVDKKALTEAISLKEDQLRRCNETWEAREKELSNVNSRADVSERSRKEVEHRVQSQEERIAKQECDIRDARYLTDEATRKHDEAKFKIEKLRQNLDKALTHAARAEDKVISLENELKKMSDLMARSVSAKEKSLKRQEHLKRQLKYTSELLKEAEHRADLEEEENEKWGQRADWLKKKMKK